VGSMLQRRWQQAGVDDEPVDADHPGQGMVLEQLGPAELGLERTSPSSEPIWPAFADIVLLAMPTARAISSALTCGRWERSKTKFSRPTAHMTPAAQLALRPRCSGEGRLRASRPTRRRHSTAYSLSSADKQKASVSVQFASARACSARGMRRSLAVGSMS
jgi:hypothetical protein